MIALGIVLVALAVAVPVAAAGNAAPPDPPAAYYGEATINGDPLPPGTTIVAKVDGEPNGSITLQEAGAYGGASAFEEKLTVNSTGGGTVTFHVGGLVAAETVEWASGDVREVNLTFTDEEPPTADAGSDLQVEVGEEVTFDGSNSTDNGVVTGYAWEFGDGTTASGDRVTHTFDEPGEYTVSLAVRDAAGRTDTDAVTVTVTDGSGDGSDSDDSGSDSGDDGGGGGGGGTDSDGDADGTVRTTTVEDGVTVQFEDVAIGATLSADLGGTMGSGAGTGLTGIEIDFTFDEQQFRLELTPHESPPEDVGSPPGAKPLSAVEVVPRGLDETSIDTIRFRFTVSRDKLPEGTTFEDVALFRVHDGDWERLETTHRGDGEFVAMSPGFSTFVIGVDSPAPTETATTEPTGGETDTRSESADSTTAASATDDGPTEAAASTPGFGVVVTLVAVGLLLAARTRAR